MGSSPSQRNSRSKLRPRACPLQEPIFLHTLHFLPSLAGEQVFGFSLPHLLRSSFPPILALYSFLFYVPFSGKYTSIHLPHEIYSLPCFESGFLLLGTMLHACEKIELQDSELVLQSCGIDNEVSKCQYCIFLVFVISYGSYYGAIL